MSYSNMQGARNVEKRSNSSTVLLILVQTVSTSYTFMLQIILDYRPSSHSKLTFTKDASFQWKKYCV